MSNAPAKPPSTEPYQIAAPAQGDRKLTILVLVERFPSRIQPWVINVLEQILVHGGRVRIASALQADDSYPAKVDDLGLVGCTLYQRLGKRSALIRSLAQTAMPWSATGALARRGLMRLVRSRGLWRGSTRDVGNRLVKLPVFGLPEVDIIHAHSMVQAYEYLDVAKELQVPLIYTFHGLQPIGVGGLPSRRRAVLFNALSLCLANTEFAKQQLMALGCPVEKVRILPQGIVLDEFPYAPGSLTKGEPLRLLTVARLHPDKGHRYALEAMRLLSNSGIVVDYRIVGSGPERARLEQTARDLSLEGRVTFLGAVNDRQLRDEYARAHIFLLPSVRDETGHHEETQGVVLQEAQASGKIVVATRTGGIPECVDDGVSAFLVPDRTPEAIASTLAEIAARSEAWPRWQQLGREWVEGRFDIRIVGERLWQIYGGLAEAGGERT